MNEDKDMTTAKFAYSREVIGFSADGELENRFQAVYVLSDGTEHVATEQYRTRDAAENAMKDVLQKR